MLALDLTAAFAHARLQGPQMLCQLLQVEPSLLQDGVVDIAPGHNTVLFQGKVLLRMMSDSTYRSAQRDTIPLPHYSELWRQRKIYADSGSIRERFESAAAADDDSAVAGRKPTARERAAARLRGDRSGRARSAQTAGGGIAGTSSRQHARGIAARDSSSALGLELDRRYARGSWGSFRRPGA